MTPGLWAAAGAGLVACALAGLRWLRVAQREHYLPGGASRFARRWWGAVGFNRLLVGVAGLAVLVAISTPWVAVVTAAVVAAGPVGLSLRGRTSSVAWTPRLRALAGTWAVLQVAALAGGTVLGALVSPGGGAAVVGLAVLGVPVLVDVACRLTLPLERRRMAPFLASAAARLAGVAPTVVAITGSYGKTSTKGYVAHLLATTRCVVASPASYNNRGGLARAVNEHLAPGTEVFVAEMGTYGPGEIAELCSWMAPRVAVITGIGPVHLERFGSEDAIVAAKAEILGLGGGPGGWAGPEVAVLNVDDPRLAALADQVAAQGVRVWRCSTLDPGADVFVAEHAAVASLSAPAPMAVMAQGQPLALGAGAPAGLAPTNVACAVAVALELGAARSEVARLVASLPVARNRLSVGRADGGFSVIDDTYNSNPAGARLALAALARHGGDARHRVVVTPGMVELGPRQAQENAAFAALAAEVATELLVVGHTNRAALLAGAGVEPGSATEVGIGVGQARRLVVLEDDGLAGEAGGQGAGAGTRVATRPQVLVVATREQAVAWVREHLGPGDVVLYENDLPDHYP